MLSDQRSYAEVVKSANRSSTRGSPNPVAAEGGAHVPARHREERYPPVDSSQVMTSSGDVYRRAESGESGEPPSSPLPDTRGARERLQRYVYTGGPSTSGEQGELCSSPGRGRRAARERLQRDDYTERHPSTDKYGEPPPSPQGGTYAARGQPHRDVNTRGAPISGPPPGTGASADDVDTRTETRERVDQPSSSPPPDRREARDLRRDVNAEGPPSFTGSPLPRLERGESRRSPPSSPPPGSRAAPVSQLQSDVNSGGGGPSLPSPTGRRADGGQYRSDGNDRGPPSSSSLAPGTRGTQGRPQRHVYTGTGGRNSPRDATLAERRASTGRGEDPLCRHPDSKARGARGGPDTSRQTGLSDYLGNPSRKSTASATRGGGRQSSVSDSDRNLRPTSVRLSKKI
ncbi:hypothetical protein ACOMHN_017781 [Nucella lapillus]